MKNHSLDTCFRCIIALSNTGAALLQRNAITDGVCVLSESMNIVRSLYPLDKGFDADRLVSVPSSPEKQLKLYQEIAAELNKANQKLAGSSAFSRNRRIAAIDLSLDDNIDLRCVQDLLQLVNPMSNNDVLEGHVINIESFDSSDKLSRDLVVAIIMYNCAIGCLLLSQIKAREDPKSARLLASSNDLFLLAFQIIKPLYENSTISLGMESLVISSIVTVLTALIVSNKQSSATIGARPCHSQALIDVQALSKAILKQVKSVLGLGPVGGFAPAA